MDLSIIIPCYNEAEGLPNLKRQIVPVLDQLSKQYSVELIFVDDGSQDDTWSILQETFGGQGDIPSRVVFERHAVNRGLGAALKTGFSAAQGEIAVTTDSDGTYRFSEIPALLEYLTPETDLVTASPYHPQGKVEGVPAYRLILSKGSSLIYRILVDWKVHTYTSLFRAYRRRVYKNVPFVSDGFLAGTELMVNSMLLGYRVREYPAALYSRVTGVSKAKILRTILAHLKYQLQILFHRLGVRHIPSLKMVHGED